MAKNMRDSTINLRKTMIGAGVSLGLLFAGTMAAAMIISSGKAGEGTGRILVRLILTISVSAGGAVSCYKENAGRVKKALLAAVPTAFTAMFISVSNSEGSNFAVVFAVNLLCIFIGILLSAIFVIKGKNKRRKK